MHYVMFDTSHLPLAIPSVKVSSILQNAAVTVYSHRSCRVPLWWKYYLAYFLISLKRNKILRYYSTISHYGYCKKFLLQCYPFFFFFFFALHSNYTDNSTFVYSCCALLNPKKLCSVFIAVITVSFFRIFSLGIAYKYTEMERKISYLPPSLVL